MKKINQSSKSAVVSEELSDQSSENLISDAELKKEAEKVKYLASRNFIQRKIANTNVLISVGSNIANFNGYIEINGSAADLWEKLQSSCQLEELAQVLEEKYGIDHENAMEDVLDFLKVLKDHNMVVME